LQSSKQGLYQPASRGISLCQTGTLVLKQYLSDQTCGTSHTGGLCSYGLLLMVVGFLQHSPAECPATALVGCVRFYGRCFDPKVYGVSVARGAFMHRKSPMSWPPPRPEYFERPFCAGSGKFAALSRKLSLTGEDAHRFDPLWIEDPLNPTNNVGRNCFRIRQIQTNLARAEDALTAGDFTVSPLRLILSGWGGQQPGTGELDGGALARQALCQDLYQSLVEHGPHMMPTPAHQRAARSNLSQQWDSVVRYSARPKCIRNNA